MRDPNLTIYELIRDNWDNTNTPILYDPAIHTGWHSTEATDPQVTVSNPQESPMGGGQSGFSAIDPTGAGPVQEIDGTVSVNCWSDREVESHNPKALTFQFSEEVKKIAKANLIDATDLRLIRYMGRTFVPPDPEDDIPKFSYEVMVAYTYEERP